jgi:uncharacterized protein
MESLLSLVPIGTAALLALAGIGACAVAALADTGAATPAPTVVTLGTATPGGGFPVYGAAFADVLNAADASLRLEPRNTKGSAENIPLLEAGQLDLALVQGEAAMEALNGVGRAPANLRVLTAMNATAGLFVVRGDSPARKIRDLAGKPVAFGARGSGLVILSRYVLDGLELDQDRDFTAIYLERAGDGPAMVLDGRVAALWGGGVGWPGFETMAKMGGRFIAPTADEIPRILAKHPFLKPLTLPAHTYPGQDAAIASVGSWSFVLARPTLPDDVAYRLARAIHRSEVAFAARLPQTRETTLANTVAAVSRIELLHPGVARYLREQGLLK